jgi:hypothetical protein
MGRRKHPRNAAATTDSIRAVGARSRLSDTYSVKIQRSFRWLRSRPPDSSSVSDDEADISNQLRQASAVLQPIRCGSGRLSIPWVKSWLCSPNGRENDAAGPHRVLRQRRRRDHRWTRRPANAARHPGSWDTCRRAALLSGHDAIGASAILRRGPGDRPVPAEGTTGRRHRAVRDRPGPGKADWKALRGSGRWLAKPPSPRVPSWTGHRSPTNQIRHRHSGGRDEAT